MKSKIDVASKDRILFAKNVTNGMVSTMYPVKNVTK